MPRSTIGQFTFMGPVGGAQPFTVLTHRLQRPEGTARQGIHRSAAGSEPGRSTTPSAPTPPCPAIGGPSGLAGDVIGLPAAEIISRLDLPSDQAARVREGAVVVPIGSALSGDSVTAWSGTFEFNDTASEPENIVVAGERELALITVPDSARKAGQVPRHTAALMPLNSPSRGLADVHREWHRPLCQPGSGDDISPADENPSGTSRQGAHFSVERGFKNEMTLFFTISWLFAFILLVIILTDRPVDGQAALGRLDHGRRRRHPRHRRMAAARIHRRRDRCRAGPVVGVLPGSPHLSAHPNRRRRHLINGIPTHPPLHDILHGFPRSSSSVSCAGLISALAVRRARW